MKTITNGFKEQLTKLGREIDFKFFLHTNDKILTEDGKFLMTEDNMQLVVEQFDEEEIDEVITGEDIFNVSIINKGNILSTMMKEIDFEITKNLRIGDIIGCQFGLKVNGNYEYVDYGKYMIYSKEFNEDTKTYNYVAFDRMLLTMQEASSDFLKTLEETTLASAISNICNQVGLSFTATTQELEDYPNLSKEINEGTFTDMEITYRDVLDMICQALGLSMIVEEKQLILKALNKTIVDSFDEQYLKDTNVSFGEKYMINSVVLSRSEDNDTIYRRDEQSIAENGVHEFKIKDNLIMLYDDREDYIDEIFNQLNGLEYYVNDFKSTGITYLDWLDFYNVTIGDKTYKCLMLNDEIKISQGLEENIYTEEPEETTTDYKTSSKTDKEVSFIVDKQNGKINAKASKDEVEASLELKIDKNDNDRIVSMINASAEVVNITANRFKLDSTYSKISENGEAEFESGTIAGFNMNRNGLSKDFNGIYDYSLLDAYVAFTYILQIIQLNDSVFNTYDVSNDGQIRINDVTIIQAIARGERVNTKTVSGTLKINSNNPKYNLQIVDSYNRNVCSLGMGGIESELIKATSIVVAESQTFASNFDDLQYVAINGKTGNIYAKGEIKATTITQSSQEEKKKNFEKYNNALKEIKNIDIYKYNYKNENDGTKKHIGFVIGDNYKYSKEITSNENNSVDIYSFISLCCKAIQEQQEMIEKLQSKIEKLEKESDK